MATYTGADKAVGYLFTASNNTAAEYNSAATYAVGDFVIYAGTLYKCTTAISTPEDWTPAHWTQTTIMENAGGGGGGGTTVIANPAGAATDTLNKLQVGSTIYDVPSGGGGSGHTYSTTEQIVGTWIDGRTVYEKTYVAQNEQTLNTNTWNVTEFSNSGLSVAISAWSLFSSGTGFPVAVALDRGNYINVWNLRNSSISMKYLILQYVKSS